MKQNNPLHKEILPQDTEETLWNRGKFTIPHFLVSFCYKMDYPEQSQMREHLKKTQLKPTPQRLWRHRVQRPWFNRKTAAWRNHFLCCRCPNKNRRNWITQVLCSFRKTSEVQKQTSRFWDFFFNKPHTTEGILWFFFSFALEVSCLSALQRQ